MLTDVMGKPSYAERITRKKNQLRSDIRQKSRVTENVLRSMQTCSIKDNLQILNDQISKLCKDEVKRNINLSLINHLKGLRQPSCKCLLSRFQVNNNMERKLKTLTWILQKLSSYGLLGYKIYFSFGNEA